MNGKRILFQIAGVLVLGILAVLIFRFLPQEGSKTSVVESDLPLMGTTVSVKVYAADKVAATRAIAKAFNEARLLEDVLSAHNAYSRLCLLNDAPCGVPFDAGADLGAALSRAKFFAELSGGAFDPTLGPCIRLWVKSKSQGKLPDADALERARAASGYDKLAIEGDMATKTVEGMRIDLGGIGKGMVVDRMAFVLKSEGFRCFCISTTSDVLVGDAPPGKEAWVVGFYPQDSKEGGKSISLVNAAVSTSGDLNQSVCIDGVYYSHVIDPATGLGLVARDVKQCVTVKAKTAAEADALSTACRVLDRKKAEGLLGKVPGASLCL